jgi:hypothetical protein
VVDKLTFDKDFQPAQLTSLALGLIANANGAIAGKGRIDWQGDKVTSSGRFGSQGLDFAAAFGPVKGLSGTLDFTDLLAMETAPHQILKVASINPGVEVTDGTVDVQLKRDQVVQVNGAQWPFMGGRLARTHHLALCPGGKPQFHAGDRWARRRAVRIADGNGQHFGHGRVRRAPAGGVRCQWGPHRGRYARLARRGNVSYVGALTYKDLSFMANYAFQALRSLDYKHMTIALRGDIAGDFVTQVQFGGVSQGAGASRNFFTRQIEGLPIQFNLNVRAPFYSLLGTYKSMYDPSVVADPRTVGLLDAKGRVVPAPGHCAHHAGPARHSAFSKWNHAMSRLTHCPLLTVHTGTATIAGSKGRKRGADVRRRVLAAGMLAGTAAALSGCISVKAPDKPIVIELNINIKQEVVYRLAGDASQTIDKNKDIF